MRFLIKRMTHLEINGLQNIPLQGPLILAGNHVAVLEAVLMITFSPRLVEVLGTGDIPLDPNYAWVANLYGFIPVNRGNLDRTALQKCLDVLAQNGVIGIFPEGGVWAPAHMQAQTGIAMLSYKAQAPIVPIGFAGMRGALAAIARLKKPKISINIGTPMPPVSLNSGETLKEGLQRSANQVLSSIDALLPEAELKNHIERLNESFSLNVFLTTGSELIPLPPDKQVSHGSALARLFYTPVLLDTLLRNLKLPILPLKNQHPIPDLPAYQLALRSILNYLEVNPGFFTYRFGVEEGLAIKLALHELLSLTVSIQDSAYALHVIPTVKFQDTSTLQSIEKSGGDFPRSMR